MFRSVLAQALIGLVLLPSNPSSGPSPGSSPRPAPVVAATSEPPPREPSSLDRAEVPGSKVAAAEQAGLQEKRGFSATRVADAEIHSASILGLSPATAAAQVEAADATTQLLKLAATPPEPGIQKTLRGSEAGLEVQEVRPPEAPRAVVAHAPDEYAGAAAKAEESALPVPARLAVRPAVLRFALTRDGVVPAAQSLEVSSDRRAGARFEVAGSSDWLTVEAGSGQARLRGTAVRIAVEGRKVAGPLSGYLEFRNLDDPSDVRRIAVEVERAEPGRPLRSRDAEGRLQRVVRPDGGILDYDYDLRGNLVRVRRPDGSAVTWSYDEQGRRTAMTDGRGTTVYRYDAQGRLDALYSPGFEPVRYGYDERNRLTVLHLPGGRVVAWEYDDTDRLTSVRSDLGTTRYGYDPVSRKLSERVLPNGVVTAYGYDPAGRLVDMIHRDAAGAPLLSFSWRLDRRGRPVSVTRESAAGRETTDLAYDQHGRIVSAADSGGRVTTYEYDEKGRRSRKVETAGGVVRVEESAYDALGRLVRAGEERFDYDVNGDLVRRSSPGRTLEYRWDFEGRLVGYGDGRREVRYEVDGDGQRVGATTDGRKVSLLQDASGWIGGVLAEAAEDGEILRSHVHGLEPLAVEGKDGEGAFYLYDHPLRAAAALVSPAGALAETFASDAFGAPLAPPAEDLPDYLFAGGRYDPVTGLLHRDGADYDPRLGTLLNSTLEKDEAPGAGSPWAEGGAGGTFSEALARAFRPAGSTPADRSSEDETGRTSGLDPPAKPTGSLSLTLFQSNELPPAAVRTKGVGLQIPSPYRLAPEEGAVYRRGTLAPAKALATPRLKLHPEYLPFAKTASGLLPASQTLEIASSDGQALSFTVAESIPWLSVSAAGGSAPAALTVTVNPAGLTEAGSPYVGDLVLTNTADATDVRKVRARLLVRSTGASVTLRSFDANGKLRRVVKPDGGIIDYEVDPLGRVTRVRYPGLAPVSYAYDGNGNRVGMTDQRGATVYQYDRQNRLVGAFTPLGANYIPVTYGYDKAGRLTSLTTPDGRTVLYQYDADGRMTRVTDGADVTTYGYNAVTGLLTGQTLPNGITTTYTYDADGRLTDVVHNKPGGTLLMGFHYTLNAVGQRTSVTKQTPAGTELTSYTYNQRGFLKSATYPDGKSVVYTYDHLGNRLTLTTTQGATTTAVAYEYDKDNRLLRAGSEVFLYDANGNMTRRSSPAGTTSYTYDARSLLTRIESGNGVVTFEYDGDGNRIAKDSNGLRTNFVNDASGNLSQVLVEANASWQVLRSYSYGHQRIADIAFQDSHYYLSDGKSNSGLADGLGAVVANYRYDAFGDNLTPVDSLRDRFLFDAESFDHESGLIFLRNRYYLPSIGRFTSRDPFDIAVNDPSTLNPYVYVGNDPVNRRDPLGLDPFFGYAHTGPGDGSGRFSLDEPISRGDFGSFRHDLRYQIAEERGGSSFANRLFLDTSLIGADFRLVGDSLRAVFDGSRPSQSEIQAILKEPALQKYLSEGNPPPAWLLTADRGNWPIQGSSVLTQVADRFFFLGAAALFTTLGTVKLTLGTAVNLVGGLLDGIGSIFSGLFGGGGSAPTAGLGGVSLNKTADLLLSLQDITGATFDEATGQIVLLGKENVSLPPLDMNQVAVATQSVYAGQDPGVSIDFPIVNHQMPVRYEGQTRNTRFGDVMFEADRVLKILGLGKDNLTGQNVSSAVPGYKNMLRRRLDAGCINAPTTVRMWFQPKEVRLVPSSDGKSMVFDAVSMEFLYESKSGNRVVSDPQAAAFASHFTQNYTAFANEWPILKKLEQLGKVVAIVKWIRDNHIPIDLSFLDNYPIEFFSTATSTPAITVQGVRQIGPLTCTLSLEGGVTYQVPNQYLPADPAAAAALREALAERPSEGAFKWTYQPSAASAARLKTTSGPVTAVAETLTRSRRDGNVRLQEIDLSDPLPGGGTLTLLRTYDSFLDKSGPLGPGWSVLPAEIRFPLRKERYLFGSANLALDLYPRIWLTERAAGREDAYDLLGIDGAHLPVYQRLDAMHLLRQQADGTFLLTREDGSTATFRADGKPTSLVDRNGNAVGLAYDAVVPDRLLRLTAAGGRTIELAYDAQGRISQVSGPGGRQVLYGYNAQGRLGTVTDFATRSRTYGYDATGRLASATDAEGRSVFAAGYDDYDRTPSRRLGATAQYGLGFDLETGQSTLTDPLGRTSRQTLERRQLASPSGIRNEVYRPKESTDPLGNRGTMTWADDAFGPRKVTDAQGATTDLAWDNRGHLTQVRDPLGRQSERFYDWRDRLVALRDPEGLATAYGYDEKNNPTTVYHDVDLVLDAEGNLDSFYYDPANVSSFTYDVSGNLAAAANPLGQQALVLNNPQGQPTRVTSPAGVVENLSYDSRARLASSQTGGRQVAYGYDSADQLTSVTTAAGATSLLRDAQGRVTRMTDALARQMAFEYDTDGHLTRVQDKSGQFTTYTYDVLGHLLSASLPNGTSNAWEHDELGRPVATLNGLGATAPAIALATESLAFGSVPVGSSRQLTFDVYNQGTAPLTLSGLSVSAPFSVPFSGPVTIQPTGVYPVTVSFTPTDSVSAGAPLSLTSNDPETPLLLVALSGEGARKVANLQATATPEGILLSWNPFNPGSQPFGHFNVYRSLTPIPGDVTGLAPLNGSLTASAATEFLDRLATPATSYYYAVTPVYANGDENKLADPAGPIAYFTTFGPLAADLPLATATQSENRPAIAYNGTANEYLVVYERSTSASNTDVYGQRVSPSGALVGGALILANASNNERRPRLAYNANSNNYLVVWEHDASGTAGTNFDLRARTVSATGVLGTTLTVASSARQDQAPEVAFGSTSREYLVAYEVDGNGDGKIDLGLLRLSATGALLDSLYMDVRSNSVNVHVTNPHLAYNSTLNDFMLVFESDTANNGSNIEIWGTRLKPDGTLLNGSLFILAFDGVRDGNPFLSYGSVPNEYLLAWQTDAVGDGANLDVAFRRVSATATQGSVVINPWTSTVSESNPRAVYNRNLDNFVLTWEAGGAAPKISASRIRMTADIIGWQNPIEVSSGTASRVRPDIGTSTASNSFLATWAEDAGAGNFNLRARLLGTFVPALQVSPASLSFGAAVTHQTLTVTNGNPTGGPLQWTATSDRPWMTALPGSGSTTSSVAVDVAVDRTGLAPGTYTGAVAVTSNNGSASVPVTVTVGNTPPDLPRVPRPLDGAVEQASVSGGMDLSLGWQGGDPDGDSVSWAVYLSTDSAKVTALDPTVRIGQGLTTPSLSPAGLTFLKQYYWRVVAADSRGGSSNGPVWRFTTAAVPAPALHPVVPDPTRETRPVLAWQAVAGAASYHLQVANNAGFSPNIVDTPGITATSFTPASALPQGTIYWRVRSLDAAVQPGAFSTPDTFGVDTTAPGIPVVVPVTPDPTNNARPTLAWSAVTGASSYRVLVSKTSGFSSPFLDVTLSTLTYQPASDLPQGMVYWRVASLDAAGNQSGYDGDQFLLDTTPPPALTGLTARRQGGGVDLAWGPLAGPPADFARFRIYRSDAPFTNVTDASLLNASLTSAAAVSFQDSTASSGTSYWYAVTAVDTAGNENREVVTAQVLANEPPGTPVLVAPAVGAQVLPSGAMSVPLAWSASDPEGDPLRFDVYLSTDRSQVEGTPDITARVAESLAQPVFEAPGLAYQRTYYWRVVALDLAADGAVRSASFGPLWSFAIPAIPAPVLTALTPDPTTQVRPTFNWQAVPGAVAYRIEIATDPAFGTIVAAAEVTETTFTPATNLPEGTLRWRVRAIDALGQPSAYSAVDDFVLDASAPAVPVLVPVTPDPTNIRRPSLPWGAVAGAASYRLQVSTDPAFATTLVDTTAPGSPFVPATDLPEARIYWRVASADVAGNQSAFPAADDFLIDATAPAVPVLVPVTPDPTNNRRPSLARGAVAGAASYRIQVSTDPAFAATVIDTTASGSPFVPATDLPEARIYWRVASKDGAGNQSAFSAADDFLIDATAPAVPVLVPVTPDPTNFRRPSLAWGVVAGASSYRIQIFSDAAFSSPLIDTTVSASPFVPPSDLPELRIYWRVASKDAAGNQSAFSAADDFLIDVTPVAVPVPIPVTPDPTSNRRPTLRWNAVPGAGTYRVKIATDPTFEFSLLIVTLSPTSYQPISDLPEGRIYWTVSSIDANSNQSAYSAPDDFLIDATAPGAPTLVAVSPDPTNNRRPNLTWAAVAEATSYRLQVSTEAAFSAPILDTTQSGTTYLPAADLPEGQIYWRVAALDAAGNPSAFSAADDFLVDATPAPVPGLVPVTPDPTSNRRPLLGWSALVDITNYRVQVSSAPTFAILLVNTIVSINSYQPASDLPEGRIYWRVASVDPVGNQSAFSAADDFLVDATPPAAPSLFAVTPDPTNNPRPSLAWGAVADATSYRLQVASEATFASLLSDTSGVLSPFTPSANLPEGRIYWRVASRDAAGNQGPFSTPSSFVSDRTPPPALTELTASRTSPGVRLVWSALPASVTDVARFHVFRSLTAFSNVTGLTPLATLEGPLAADYADSTAAAGTTYHYAVTTQDLAGNELQTVASVAAPPATGGLYTIVPCRVLDTRNAAGPYGGPVLAAQQPRSFALAGRCGIPATARALVVNYTVVSASAAGSVKAYPGGIPSPVTSVINFAAGQIRANNGILTLQANGTGTVVLEAALPAGATVHVLVDVAGYFE